MGKRRPDRPPFFVDNIADRLRQWRRFGSHLLFAPASSGSWSASGRPTSAPPQELRSSTIIVIAALLVSATVLAQQSNQEKVICELSSGNCLKQAEVIQKKIKKLNVEIKKGEKKYPPRELKNLELKLKETQETLDKFESVK